LGSVGCERVGKDGRPAGIHIDCGTITPAFEVAHRNSHATLAIAVTGNVKRIETTEDTLEWERTLPQVAWNTLHMSQEVINVRTTGGNKTPENDGQLVHMHGWQSE